MKTRFGPWGMVLAVVAAGIACAQSGPAGGRAAVTTVTAVREPTALPPTATATPLPPKPGAAGLGDDYYPDLGNGGYDTQHYTITLDVDVDAGKINSADVLIQAVARQALSAFDLDFSGLTVDSVQVNGAEASYTRAAPELTITPDRPLPDGAPFSVEVRYHGTPKPIVPQAVPLETGWVAYDGGILTMGEPTGAEGWFPNNNHPLDKATYSFVVSVPHPYVVAANGEQISAAENGNKTTYTWEARDPIASYLVTVQFGKYIVETQQGPNGLPIRNYYPKALADEASKDFAPTGDMIAYFNTIFGPYPFETYGVVVADTDLGYELESQTLTLFGRAVVTAPYSIEPTVAHELSHHWFGDSVTPRQWHDIWLNEGFATYASLLWDEHTEGEAVFDQRVKNMYTDLPSDMGSMGLVGKPPKDDLFNGAVYNRGAMTLHALRKTVGDEAFFNILRTWTARYKYGNASTEDFIALAEEISGKKLGDLFDAWLYQSKKPPMPE